MKRIFMTFLIVLLIFSNAAAVDAFDDSFVNIDTGKLDSGTINVSCHKENSNGKLKVMVEKDGRRVYYDLKNDGTYESYPLQFGNGDYIISVLENIGGNSYKYISKKTVTLKLENDLTVYLASVQNINWDQDNVSSKKASELTKGLKTDNQKIEAIYNYVISNIRYDHEKTSLLTNGYVPDVDQTILDKQGICYDFASVFAAMLRSQGIPAKLIKGYTPNAAGYHAWNEVYNSATGKWMVIDTTYDSKMKELKAKYSMEKNAQIYNVVNEY